MKRKWIAFLLCGTSVLATTVATAALAKSQCTYAGLEFSEGTIVNGQECVCFEKECWWESVFEDLGETA